MVKPPRCGRGFPPYTLDAQAVATNAQADVVDVNAREVEDHYDLDRGLGHITKRFPRLLEKKHRPLPPAEVLEEALYFALHVPRAHETHFLLHVAAFHLPPCTRYLL
jgi:hypothetical protein